MSRIKMKAEKDYPLWVRILFYLQRRKYGVVFEPTKVWARRPKLLWQFTKMFKKLFNKRALIDPQTRGLVCVKVAETNHCPFCIDMNAALYLKAGGDEKKLQALETFEESDLFSKKEVITLRFAEKVTHCQDKVSDKLFSQLKEHYTDDAIVELTALITFQNMSAKFNSALDIPSHHLCKVPL